METYTTEMKVPGGKLRVTTAENETANVSVFFVPDGTEVEFDIAYIETYYNNTSIGNVGDISTYVYGDPDVEDYTEKFTVKVRDIERICSEGGYF